MPGRVGLGINNNSMRISEGLEKPGTIKAWGNATIPNGWLELDGLNVSQAAWPNLFAIYGTAYNTGGEGAGQFRVPNIVGSTIIGAGTYLDPALGFVSRTIGTGFLGRAAVLLTSDQLAGHAHTPSDPTHTHGLMGNAGGGLANLNGATQIAGLAGASATGYVAGPPYVQQVSTGITINPTVGNNTHENMPPSFVQKWIVKG